MNLFRNLAPKNAWLDTAVIAVLLVIANFFFAETDFGWRQMNPSPWFLLPILIGSRYGFTAGICSGLAGILVIWFGLSSVHILSLADFIRVFGIFSAGMILAGGICGEIALALQNKTAVSIPEFWQRPGGDNPEHLIAVPLLDARDNPIAVLVVTGTPFIALTKKAVHLIALICRWAARVLEITRGTPGTSRLVEGTESQRIFTSEFFRENLELSLQSYRQHELPSAVVLFLLPNHARAQQKQFEALVMAGVRNGDFPAEIGLPVPHLAVLLPLCGERGANIFLERILAGCQKDAVLGPEVRTRLVTFDQVRTFEELWMELTNYVAYAGEPR